jgi:hypothetical protein
VEGAFIIVAKLQLGARIVANTRLKRVKALQAANLRLI